MFKSLEINHPTVFFSLQNISDDSSFFSNKNSSSRGKWFKGTVSVVSSDPPCKDDNARFITRATL